MNLGSISRTVTGVPGEGTKPETKVRSGKGWGEGSE